MGNVANKDNKTVDEAQGNEYKLMYLDASDPVGDTAEKNTDFIKDIDEFKKELPIIEVPRVQLAQC